MKDVLIVNKWNNECFNSCDSASADAEIFRALCRRAEDIALYADYIVRYPDNAAYWQERLSVSKKMLDAGYEAISYEEYSRRERAKWLSGEPEETTEGRFNEMLDILPPLYWCSLQNVEMFCMSEMTSGSFTMQYAHDKLTGKYWCKMVDCCDRSTWINKFLRDGANQSILSEEARS